MKLKYFIGEYGQGSPFRLNDLADKAEKAPYSVLLQSSLSETPRYLDQRRPEGGIELRGRLC
jgi:hypothetical protein